MWRVHCVWIGVELTSVAVILPAMLVTSQNRELACRLLRTGSSADAGLFIEPLGDSLFEKNTGGFLSGVE